MKIYIAQGTTDMSMMVVDRTDAIMWLMNRALAATHVSWWMTLTSTEHVQILVITVVATFVATFIATLPTVYVGIRLERSNRDKETRARHHGYLMSKDPSSGYPNGQQFIYSIRDWARVVHYYYWGQMDSLELQGSERPGSETLRFLLASDSFPVGIQSEVMQLADYCTLLNHALVSAMFVKPTEMNPEGRMNIMQLAKTTHELANRLVKDPSLFNRD